MADCAHHIARIVAPLRHAPQAQLFRQIGGALPGKRRIASADALATRTVTRSAGDEAALGHAAMVEIRSRRLGGWRPGMSGHRGIKGRDGLLFAIVEAAGDPRHLRMIAPAIGISGELPLEIARVQPGEARRPRSVAAAVKPMAGETGIGRARPSATQGDDPAIGGKAVVRRGIDRAGGKQGAEQGGDKARHYGGTGRRRGWFRLAMLLPLIAHAACKPPPEPDQAMPLASATNGKAVIERVGCGACHDVPGIDWPKGAAGPALDGLAGRALIAGVLPNRPDVLAAYVRNAPALVPGSAMPALPLSADEARDIAAYLYQQGGD